MSWVVYCYHEMIIFKWFMISVMIYVFPWELCLFNIYWYWAWESRTSSMMFSGRFDTWYDLISRCTWWWERLFWDLVELGIHKLIMIYKWDIYLYFGLHDKPLSWLRWISSHVLSLSLEVVFSTERKVWVQRILLSQNYVLP